MTNENLGSLINDLNAGRKKSLIHLRPISDNVEFAKVWLNEPKKTERLSNHNGPDSFYFIKKNNGRFVGIVYDMKYDLHWYISPRYRKKGYLVSALQQSIIQHLFRKKTQLTISINKSEIGDNFYYASQKVAFAVGFKKVNETQYILSRKNHKNNSSILEVNGGFSHERMIDLQNQINYVARTLWVIQTEIEMKYGTTGLSKELIKLKDQITKKYWGLEDLWYDQKDIIDNK